MAEKEKIGYADKPWQKSYFIGPFKLKPSMEPYPKINVYQFLDDSATNFPDKVACVYVGEEITYKEFTHSLPSLRPSISIKGFIIFGLCD